MTVCGIPIQDVIGQNCRFLNKGCRNDAAVAARLTGSLYLMVYYNGAPFNGAPFNGALYIVVYHIRHFLALHSVNKTLFDTM